MTWLEERRLRLTALNFGLIINRKPHSNSAPVIKQLLYTTIDCAAMRYGKSNEKVALQHLSDHIKKYIEECGLFVDDEELPFLAATSEGLIDDDRIFEVTCLAS
uniref:YqaJ viral recombinase domain-containing protein n=1 Tax=Graphocephala atropunctata TaxID=36148 RepID=A0A1B6MTD1_9HEMI